MRFSLGFCNIYLLITIPHIAKAKRNKEEILGLR